MLLRHKHGIEIPERALDKLVGRHLRETTRMISARNSNTVRRICSPHVKENLPKLLSHLQQRMQRPTLGLRTGGIKVVLFVSLCLPRSAGEHLRRQVRLELLDFQCKFGTLGNRVVNVFPARERIRCDEAWSEEDRTSG